MRNFVPLKMEFLGQLSGMKIEHYVFIPSEYKNSLNFKKENKMKKIIMMSIVTLTVNLAVAETRPKNDLKVESSRESRNNKMNHENHMIEKDNIDSVTTGQSSTRTRKNIVTPTNAIGQDDKCYDKNGFWVSKSDAGYESCLKANNQKMK